MVAIAFLSHWSRMVPYFISDHITVYPEGSMGLRTATVTVHYVSLVDLLVGASASVTSTPSGFLTTTSSMTTVTLSFTTVLRES